MLFVIFKLAWPLRRTRVTLLSAEHILLALLSPESGEAGCDFSLYYIDGKREKTGPLGKPASSLLVGCKGTFTVHQERRSPNAADTKPFETEGICV